MIRDHWADDDHENDKEDTMHIERNQLWQALQDVDDGQDPGEVYSRVMTHPTEDDAAWADMLDTSHPHELCREKHERNGYCMGNECQIIIANEIVTLECPCECHDLEHKEIFE